MTTDYSYSIIVHQRQQDFAAEAAADRLARIATSDHESWWHRLGRNLLPGTTHTTRTLTAQHHAAH